MSVLILYDHVLCFGGLEAPILYMTLMYYDVTSWMLIEIFYDDRFLFIFTCV